MTQEMQECNILLVEPNGGSVQSCATIPVETCILLRIDGNDLHYVTCTPSDVRELAYGRLLTEGMVESATDIESVTVAEDGCIMDVCLAHDARLRFFSPEGPVSKDVHVCDTVGNMGSYREGISVLSCGRPSWSYDSVFELARAFAADTPMHLVTSGAHSCTLVAKDGSQFCCEDIGRHNALDKAIGKAMLAGVDLSSSLIFSSGRIPADMVSKVVRARIPVLVSKGVPTDMGVQIAKNAGLTLICAARPDSIKVFNE